MFVLGVIVEEVKVLRINQRPHLIYAQKREPRFEVGPLVLLYLYGKHLSNVKNVSVCIIV